MSSTRDQRVRYGWRAFASAVCVGLLASAGEPQSRADSTEERATADARGRTAVVTGFTTPFRTVTLAAVRTGRVAELPAAEGSFIQAGEEAVRLIDTVQRRRVDIAEAQAESMLEIDLASVRLAQAERELKRVAGLEQDSSVSAKELSDAQAEAEAARLELELARFRHGQAQREHALQQALLAELCIRAPFAGYVSEHLKDIGDTVEDRDGVLTLTQLDPLLVVFDCPLELAPIIRQGGSVSVLPVYRHAESRPGDVVFVSRVADPASQTVRVKIRIPNENADWVAGEKVRVDVRPAPAAKTTTNMRESESASAHAVGPVSRATSGQEN